jgi:hypothetical protein
MSSLITPEEEWHHGATIGWYASDLVRLGYIKSLDEWLEFIDVVSDSCMKYFEDKEKENVSTH